MKKMLIAASLICVILAGCAPANITSAKWDSGLSGANIQTQCEQVDMRSNSEMDSIFSKYAGWKLIYVSEFTTGNRFGTSGVACFERNR